MVDRCRSPRRPWRVRNGGVGCLLDPVRQRCWRASQHNIPPSSSTVQALPSFAAQEIKLLPGMLGCSGTRWRVRMTCGPKDTSAARHVPVVPSNVSIDCAVGEDRREYVDHQPFGQCAPHVERGHRPTACSDLPHSSRSGRVHNFVAHVAILPPRLVLQVRLGDL